MSPLVGEFPFHHHICKYIHIMAQIPTITNTPVPKSSYFDLSSTPLQSHPFNTVYPISGHPPDTRSCFTVASIIPFSPNQGKFSSPIHLECSFMSPFHPSPPPFIPDTHLIKSMPRIPLLLAVTPLPCRRQHKFPGRWKYLGSQSLITE
jgi:hypothetical protein